MISLEIIWEKFNDYVQNELMFDSFPSEILGFPEWAYAHYKIPQQLAEEWFYVNV